jgi:RNA polymerase sigma-70 factor (ECF subfamily)
VRDERSDVELVGAAQEGDREALDALLRRHHDRIRALARRLTGNDADADDATQEALLSIVRGLPRFDQRSSFGTWAYRIATNACLDELRRRGRRPRPDPDALAARPAPGSDTGDVVSARLDVDAALAALPVEFRAAVVLRDLCALDYAEIASVLDIPAGTVRSRIARGRAQIAALLGNPTDDGERPRTSP